MGKIYQLELREVGESTNADAALISTGTVVFFPESALQRVRDAGLAAARAQAIALRHVRHEVEVYAGPPDGAPAAQEHGSCMGLLQHILRAAALADERPLLSVLVQARVELARWAPGLNATDQFLVFVWTAMRHTSRLSERAIAVRAARWWPGMLRASRVLFFRHWVLDHADAGRLMPIAHSDFVPYRTCAEFFQDLRGRVAAIQAWVPDLPAADPP